MAHQTKKDQRQKRLASLKQERNSFDAHYKELSRFVQPRRGRFHTQARNKGSQGTRYNDIINSTATKSLRTSKTGLFAGTASPSRSFFHLETEDPELREFYPVKIWLKEVERLFQNILAASNFYSMTPTMLGELLLFGTGAMSHFNDFENVAQFYTHTVGSYYISQDSRYQVNTFAREWEMTTAQIFDQFGNRGGGANNKHISPAVNLAFDRGNYDIWFPVKQLIQPNDLFDEDSKLARKFRFQSVYWEEGMNNPDAQLHQGGFRLFPVYAPRWDLTGEDIYGTDCPGMTALGDIKQLQEEERKKARAISHMADPPVTGPPSLKNTTLNALPGGSTIYEVGENKQKLEPLFQVDPRLQELRADMEAVERRIEGAFLSDLFRAISSMEGVQPRNQLELSQRNQERLLELGPPLERLQGEFYELVIERLWDQSLEARILPTMPPALRNKTVKPKFISTLAQAQRSVETGNIERVFQFGGMLVESGYEVATMKLDPLQAIDEYADAIGVTPSIIVPDDVVEKQLAAKAAQEAQERQVAMLAQTAAAAKDASGVDVGGGETLTGSLAKRALKETGE